MTDRIIQIIPAPAETMVCIEGDEKAPVVFPIVCLALKESAQDGAQYIEPQIMFPNGEIGPILDTMTDIGWYNSKYGVTFRQNYEHVAGEMEA